jgi:hypothetical protein
MDAIMRNDIKLGRRWRQFRMAAHNMESRGRKDYQSENRADKLQGWFHVLTFHRGRDPRDLRFIQRTVWQNKK